MDRRGALAQRPRATARPRGEDLGDHGQRHLLRPVGADVEPDGPIHPPFLYLRLGGEGAEDALGALARPEHPDVRRGRLEERPYVRQIVREVVGHDHGVARGVERQHSGEPLAGALQQLRGGGEALAGEKARSPVHHHDPEPHVGREASERPGVISRAEDHELGRRLEHIDEHPMASELVDPRLVAAQQLARLGRRAGIQVLGAEIAVGAVARNDEPFPLPRTFRTDREWRALVEQRPLPRPRLPHRLEQHVHLPLTSHPQVPRLNLVGARAVATELGPAGADDLERDLAHVLLEAAAAHIAGRRPLLGHGQLGAFVTVRRAPHPHYGGERGALPLTQDEGEEVQHFSGLVPVFHELACNLPRQTPSLLAVGPRVPSPLLSRTKEERRHSVKHLAWLLIFAALPAALVTTRRGPEDESVFVHGLQADQHESLLYVWTSDADQKDPDFLTVIDVDPKSPGYGKVIETAPTGSTANEAHHFGYTVNADRIFAGGLFSNRLFIYDVAADPKHPKLIKTVPDLAASTGYSGPHTLYAVPGGLVKLDNDGTFLQALPAPDYMYDVGIKPELNLIVTSSWAHPHAVKAGNTPMDQVGDVVV